jgi:hypothetical protein
MTAATARPEVSRPSSATRLRSDLPALIPGLAMVGLFLVWAVHNGGYDNDTWYWGALATLALLVGTVLALGFDRIRLTRATTIALALFALYVCWSYLSILWAQSPGTALEGSNRALMYLLVFALMAILPWTLEAAVLALIAFTVGIGVTAIVLLVHLAVAGDVSGLFVGGRLAAPAGYINATAALFTMGALPSVALASRRELPGLLRGVLLAFATAELQLAITVQSRGWLFTLPLIAIASIVLVPDRLRVTLAAVLPAAGAAVVARRLLDVYQNAPSDPLTQLAHHAAPDALMACAGVFVLGTLAAWADGLREPPPLSRRARAAIGTTLVVGAVAAVAVVGLVVSSGRPGHYISREWHGFAHTELNASDSHFTDVGSGRYDFWRVSLDAFKAHPVGGIGMDNFADYYVPRGRSGETPSWPHSLQLRLLAMTGIVGFALFAGFLLAALTAVIQARRRASGLAVAAVAAATLPAVVWLIHGSLDWFWEMPALSGPALGLTAMAGSLSARARHDSDTGTAAVAAGPTTASRPGGRSAIRPAAAVLAIAAAVASAIVLVFPYLSVREVSNALAVQYSHPAAALRDLRIAADLNPLDSDPGRVAGAIALRDGRYEVALQRFRQSIDREPGGWFPWLGAGLAASELGRRRLARHDYRRAHAIYPQQGVVDLALKSVSGRHHPLSSQEALRVLGISG